MKRTGAWILGGVALMGLSVQVVLAQEEQQPAAAEQQKAEAQAEGQDQQKQEGQFQSEIQREWQEIGNSQSQIVLFQVVAHKKGQQAKAELTEEQKTQARQQQMEETKQLQSLWDQYTQTHAQIVARQLGAGQAAPAAPAEGQKAESDAASAGGGDELFAKLADLQTQILKLQIASADRWAQHAGELKGTNVFTFSRRRQEDKEAARAQEEQQKQQEQAKQEAEKQPEAAK